MEIVASLVVLGGTGLVVYLARDAIRATKTDKER